MLVLPVRRQALHQVLEAEGILITRASIRRRAYVDGGNGSYIITVRDDLAGEAYIKVVLHEYAHIHLHMGSEDGEVTRHLFPCRRGDVREAEADLLAAALWYGEDATPDFGPVARLMAKVDARQLIRPVTVPLQLAFEMPLGVPMYRSPAGPATDYGSFNPDAGWTRRPRNRYKGPRLKLGDSHDSLLFDWGKNGKPLGYFHLQKGWCDIWDSMYDRVLDGRTEILPCGDRRAQRRDFVFSSTERYRYLFKQNEKRGRSPKELDAQIAASAPVAATTPIAKALLFRATPPMSHAPEEK